MKHQNESNTAKPWDAGDSGCGQLVVGLRRQLAPLESGELLEVTARNAGAPFDLPAWCRISGNALVSAAHPVYLVQKKYD
jgi:tRNA 2-thiouridine synthesizing protein A